MDDLLKLQMQFENGEISEFDLSEQEIEQLSDLYDKQCKDIENDTRKTLRRLGLIFFEIIADIVERYCGVKKDSIRLNTLVVWELGNHFHYREKLFREIESTFEVSINKEEMEDTRTVEDLLNLVVDKKGLRQFI